MNIESVLSGSQRFAESFIPFLVTALAVLTGMFIIYSGILDIYRKGANQRGSSGSEASYAGIAGKMLIGGLLLRLGATMEDVSTVVFGTGIQDYHGVLAYAPLPAQSGIWKQVFEVVLLWVVALGWAGAFRGLLLWTKAANGGGGGGQQGDLLWQGAWHLLGGAAAINMTGMVQSFFGK